MSLPPKSSTSVLPATLLFQFWSISNEGNVNLTLLSEVDVILTSYKKHGPSIIYCLSTEDASLRILGEDLSSLTLSEITHLWKMSWTSHQGLTQTLYLFDDKGTYSLTIPAKTESPHLQHLPQQKTSSSHQATFA